MRELSWIRFARRLIGTHEIKGRRHNPKVVKMWTYTFAAIGKSSWYKDDETPWCGGFVGYVFAKVGLTKHIPSVFPRASAWLGVGTPLTRPAYGCVVVFTRRGGGHVGFVVGKDRYGNIMVLGGNQGDAVNIKPFPVNRVSGYRWCGTMKRPGWWRYNLPLLNSNGEVSTNEA